MNLVETNTKKLLMTPAQAEKRHLLVDGSPVITAGKLAQWRYESKARGELIGPPYRKIGRCVFYEVGPFDQFMQGEAV